jgi:ribosomal protein S18 acetylase RimI-like enzyme
MGLTYFKRYRMEVDLAVWQPPACHIPRGYELLPWEATSAEAHADAKFLSFQGELDSSVFPCLATREGCLNLMREISCKRKFVPQATWLAVSSGRDGRGAQNCGTVQGILDSGSGYGAIQNLGIAPAHRGLGLGTALLCVALDGFRHLRVPRVYLEVTAQNEAAVRLYQRVGFRRSRTAYRAVELAVS